MRRKGRQVWPAKSKAEQVARLKEHLAKQPVMVHPVNPVDVWLAEGPGRTYTVMVDGRPYDQMVLGKQYRRLTHGEMVDIAQGYREGLTIP